jgi:cell division protein FtsB
LNIHEKAVTSQNRLTEAQAELASLGQQKESLSNSISYLSTSAGIETELREKYHAIKPGESVAVIVGDSSGDASSTSSSTPSESLWGRLVDFIGF